MNSIRYTIDLLNPTKDDLEWFDRTMKNVADLINVNNKHSDTSAVLVITPLEEDHDHKDQNG